MPYRRQLTLVARFMTSLKGHQVHLARSVSEKKKNTKKTTKTFAASKKQFSNDRMLL